MWDETGVSTFPSTDAFDPYEVLEGLMTVTTIANSVRDFTNSQGNGGWYYGYYSGSLTSESFKQLPYFSNGSDVKNGWWAFSGSDFYTAIDIIGGHPHGPVSTRPANVEHWSVRRWISSATGTIRLSGNINDVNRGGGGDGVTGRIIIDGKEIYSSLANHSSPMSGNDYSIEVETKPGQVIDFAIDPNAWDGDDGTQFTVNIEQMQVEPIIRGNSLYTIVDGPSWTQAEANSVKLGGHLTTVNDSHENTFIVNSFSDKSGEYQGLWIGLSDAGVEGNFTWTSQDVSSYRNFFPSEPNGGISENYVHMWSSNPWSYNVGSWNDIGDYPDGGNPDPSGKTKYFKGIAETPFIRRGDSAYVIVQGPTWEEAEANAVKLGGHLVTINDAAENEWIAPSFGGRRNYDYKILTKELKTIFRQGKQSQILQIQWSLIVSEANGAKGTFQGATPFDIVKTTKDNHEIINLFDGYTQYGNDYKDTGEVTNAELVEWITKYVDKSYVNHPMWDDIEEQL